MVLHSLRKLPEKSPFSTALNVHDPNRMRSKTEIAMIVLAVHTEGTDRIVFPQTVQIGDGLLSSVDLHHSPVLCSNESTMLIQQSESSQSHIRVLHRVHDLPVEPKIPDSEIAIKTGCEHQLRTCWNCQPRNGRTVGFPLSHALCPLVGMRLISGQAQSKSMVKSRDSGHASCP